MVNFPKSWTTPFLPYCSNCNTFWAGALSETAEACKCLFSFCRLYPGCKELRTGNLLIKHQTHAKALLGTEVPRQEVSHKAPMPNMPTSPEVWPLQEEGECVWECVWEVLSKNISQWRGPCSRPGSSSGAPHWPVTVKTLPPHLPLAWYPMPKMTSGAR